MKFTIVKTISLLLLFSLISYSSINCSENPLYHDSGNGICLIYTQPTDIAFEKRYIKWKTDFPKRYENIISIAWDGHGLDRVAIFYRTERLLDK